MANLWRHLKVLARRFRLVGAAILLLALLAIFWLGNALIGDYVVEKVKEAAVRHHWELTTKLISWLTTYPTRSALIITCAFLVVSELHNRVKTLSLWRDVFGGDKSPQTSASARDIGRGPEVILSTEWPSDWPPHADHPPMRFVAPLNQAYERPFVVSNDSEITAHNVKIRNLERNGKRAEFRTIDFVRRGEDKPSVPRVVVGEENPMRGRSIAPLFDDYVILGALHAGRGAQLAPTLPVITDYEDSHGGRWETEQEMAYDIWRKTAVLRLVYCGPRRV